MDLILAPLWLVGERYLVLMIFMVSSVIRLKEQKKALMGKGYKTLFSPRNKEHKRHKTNLK
jgi:hypothetical protein